MVSIVPSRFFVALIASGTLTLKGSPEGYGYRGRKVADPPERKILNVVDPHFPQCGGPTCERE